MTKPFIDLASDREAMRGVLLEMGLITPAASIEVTSLTGGVSSSILKITAATNVFCIKQALPKLKVQKDWYVPTDRVFAEIGWLETIAAFAPQAVPEILGVDRQNGCFAMAFLPPDQFPNWKAMLLEGKIDINFAGQVGETLAKIHSRTAHNAAIEDQFANDTNFYAIRLEPYLAETARVHQNLSGRLIALLDRTRQQKTALMHGDVSPKNILCGPSGPVFIDAECASYGDPAFDLAFCINHLLLKALNRPTQIDAYLASFEALCSAYLANVSWEASQDFEKRAATLLPGLTLARADGKSPVEYLDDAQRNIVRRAAIAALEAEYSSLAEVKTLWEKELRS